MPEYDDRASAPPSSATVWMIVALSIVVLIASGYMVFNYSSARPTPAAPSMSTNAK